jgi:hypothetical protein
LIALGLEKTVAARCHYPESLSSNQLSAGRAKSRAVAFDVTLPPYLAT